MVVQADIQVTEGGGSDVLRANSSTRDSATTGIRAADDLSVRESTTSDDHGHDIGPVVSAEVLVDDRASSEFTHH